MIKAKPIRQEADFIDKLPTDSKEKPDGDHDQNRERQQTTPKRTPVPVVAIHLTAP
jgi:hypothetical protein